MLSQPSICVCACVRVCACVCIWVCVSMMLLLLFWFCLVCLLGWLVSTREISLFEREEFLYVWISLVLLIWVCCEYCLFVGCLTSQQHASVSQGRICSDNFTCCHTEIEVADQTFYLTQSQYTDTGPTSPSTNPIVPGAWQGSHWSANFWVTGVTQPWKNPGVSGIWTQDLLLSRWMPYQ